jgi:hypothetical protein
VLFGPSALLAPTAELEPTASLGSAASLEPAAPLAPLEPAALLGPVAPLTPPLPLAPGGASFARAISAVWCALQSATTLRRKLVHSSTGFTSNAASSSCMPSTL